MLYIMIGYERKQVLTHLCTYLFCKYAYVYIFIPCPVYVGVRINALSSVSYKTLNIFAIMQRGMFIIQ